MSKRLAPPKNPSPIADHVLEVEGIAGRMNKLIAVLLLSALSVLAQDKPASPHRPVKAAQKFYPVSKYVRKIGVLYLQTIDEFDKHCDGQMSNPAVQSECSAAMINWDSAFDQIEKVVDIELSDSKSIGDRRTWDLLKEVKMSTHMHLEGFVLNGDPGKALMETWMHAMSTCRSYANFAVFGSGSPTVDADIGTYSGDGGCSELIEKALNHKSAPETISEGLPAKCTPFVDGSVEKVLAKTIPLPPRECRRILGWMRDSRLDALYNGQPKQ